MCIWIFNGARFNFTGLQLLDLGNFLDCRVWSLCNELLFGFSTDVSQTLQTCCGHIEKVHVGVFVSTAKQRRDICITFLVSLLALAALA